MTTLNFHKKIVALLIIASFLIGTVIVTTNLGGSLKKQSLISVDQLYVDPQGATSDTDISGLYWNLLFHLQGQNVVQGIKLPAGTTGTTTIQTVQKVITTGKTVEIDITPGQPYMIRKMQLQQMMVAPAAQGTVGNSQPEVDMQYYNWLEPSFRVYMPYHVTVIKDGTVIGQADLGGEINSDGTPVSPDQNIPTSDGTIILENLGGLQQTYMNPAMPGQIAMLQGAPYIYDLTQISASGVASLDGTNIGSGSGTSATSYSAYWYGTSRTSGNVAQNPTRVINLQLTSTYPPSAYGGWEGSNYGGSVTAVHPVILPGSRSQLPTDKQSFLTAVEWLASKNVANLVAGGSSVLAKYSSYSLVTDGGDAAMKIIIPFNAYFTPLLTMRVPAAMADAWVERPQVSDVAVNGYWVNTGDKSGDIADQSQLAVDCTQKSTVKSTARISVSSSDPRISVYPIQDYVTLYPNQKQTKYFTVSQTGGTTPDNGVTITINSYDDYSGQLKETDTVTANLLATVGQNTTTLIILVKDDSAAQSPISAMQMSIVYPPQTGQEVTTFTDEHGLVSLTLTTPQGGGYTGQVQIITAASITYAVSNNIVTVHSGPNNVPIVVHINGTPTPTPAQKSGGLSLMTIILIAVITIVIIVFVAIGYTYHKKRSGM